MFSETQKSGFRADDIRYVRKGEDVHALVLGWPDDGVVRLKFKAKGGKLVNRTLRDKRLHSIMHRIGDLPGRHLFSWIDDEGEVQVIVVSDYYLDHHESS